RCGSLSTRSFSSLTGRSAVASAKVCSCTRIWSMRGFGALSQSVREPRRRKKTLDQQPKQTLQDRDVIRRAAEWYGQCVARIEREMEAEQRRKAVEGKQTA